MGQEGGLIENSGPEAFWEGRMLSKILKVLWVGLFFYGASLVCGQESQPPRWQPLYVSISRVNKSTEENGYSGSFKKMRNLQNRSAIQRMARYTSSETWSLELSEFLTTLKSHPEGQRSFNFNSNPIQSYRIKFWVDLCQIQSCNGMQRQNISHCKFTPHTIFERADENPKFGI